MTLSTTDQGPRPAGFTDVRGTNLALVLDFVRRHAPCSRSEIATGTGLNKATVSSLVGELIDRRLVRETGTSENRIGRPAVMLVLDGREYAAIGLEINADYLAAVAVDIAGRRLLSWRQAFDSAGAGPDRALARLATLARRAVGRVERAGHQVLGVAAAVPGLVEAGSGTVLNAPGLGWRAVDLRGALVRALGDPAFPVLVDNDAGLGALAEYRHGEHRGTAHLIQLTGEVGVGAGVISGGRLLRGAAGHAGAVGHIPLDPAGPPCACGRRGCLDALVNLPALVAETDPDATAEDVLADLGAEVEDLAGRAAAGDAAVLERLERAGDWLGRAVAVLVGLFNPEVLVLGGHFVTLAPWLLPHVERVATELTLAPDLGGARLATSKLGFEAAALGATASVLDTVEIARLRSLDRSAGAHGRSADDPSDPAADTDADAEADPDAAAVEAFS
ncbi:ROK family transcriptional regulator [Allostreptomyces psammosilenae]|uniref:Putative NBD/HSP70 family sugar kinase n=1 Tax=Allostreptomyces psammosilenae TaxID=1892865 RepID=A0A852ZPW0_9ACTN|nr:ROK family transcriptional regulator [Allostreptomyces psammosilenae]NYI04409.1 putative NBD/HSP70 family sugar kinase [Allostreptomyces psammosilenae]